MHNERKLMTACTQTYDCMPTTQLCVPRIFASQKRHRSTYIQSGTAPINYSQLLSITINIHYSQLRSVTVNPPTPCGSGRVDASS